MALTRRQFVTGMVGAGVLAAGSGLLLSGCSQSDADSELIEALKAIAPSAKINSLKVTDEQIVSGYDFADAPNSDYFVLDRSYNLPIGCLVYQNSDRNACVLTHGEENNVLIRLAVLDLETGELTTILDRAVGHSSDFVIYDARSNSSVLAWVECDLSTGEWVVYAAVLMDTQLGTVVELDRGETDYDPPMLCVNDVTVYWTVMPDANGPAYLEDSFLKAARVTGNIASNQRVVYTSHGRMITNPQASGGVITIVPRVDTDTVRYQLTALDANTDQIIAVSILPSGLRVSDCVYVAGSFTFCIESNYTFAEGLRYYGTYEDLGNEQFFHANRVPASPAVFANNCLMIKSTTNIVGFHIAREYSFILDKPNDCADYGDLLAGCGAQNQLVVYTTIVNKTDAEKNTTQVRIYTAAAPETAAAAATAAATTAAAATAAAPAASAASNSG